MGVGEEPDRRGDAPLLLEKENGRRRELGRVGVGVVIYAAAPPSRRTIGQVCPLC